MKMIIFSDKWGEKTNNDELLREIISYDVGKERADMMAVIEKDGYVKIYNMDNNHYYDANDNGNIIPDNILEELINMAEYQIKADYEKLLNGKEKGSLSNE